MNIVITILMFLFVYNIDFKNVPTILSSGKISVVLLLLLYIQRKRHKTNLENKKSINMNNTIFFITMSYIFILLYSIVLYFARGQISVTLVSRIIYFITNVILTSFIFSTFFKNRIDLCRCYVNATFIQSIFIIISFFSSNFRTFVYNILDSTSNLSLDFAGRAAGFSNSSGAALSLVQGIGVIACVYIFLVDNKKNDKLALYLKAISLMLSIFFSGRTGFILVGIVVPILVLDFKVENIKYFISFKFFATIIACSLLVALVLNLNNVFSYLLSGTQYEQSMYLMKLNSELFQGTSSESYQILKEMPIPPLDADTIVGTSLIEDVYGNGNASENDSGYIQLYYAIGLPMAGIFYITLFIHLVCKIKLQKQNLSKIDIKLLVAMIIAMYVLENKEPFIFKYILPFFVFSFINTKNCIFKTEDCKK